MMYSSWWNLYAGTKISRINALIDNGSYNSVDRGGAPVISSSLSSRAVMLLCVCVYSVMVEETSLIAAFREVMGPHYDEV